MLNEIAFNTDYIHGAEAWKYKFEQVRKRFFPKDVFGGSTRNNPGREVTIKVENIFKKIRNIQKKESVRQYTFMAFKQI